MSLTLRITTGSLAGRTVEAASDEVRVGREAGFELRFDPALDLAVSARHAVLTRSGANWLLQDLGSTNGTYVNGRRITSETRLRAGDRIQFGAAGPVVEVVLPGGRQALPLGRIALASAFALMALTTTYLVVHGRSERRAWEAERAALLARVDSAAASSEQSIRSVDGSVSGLADELRASQAEVRKARTRLLDAKQAPEATTQLAGALAELSTRQRAADIDHEAIRRRNARAIARIFVETDDGEVTSGTGFAVRADALLLTSRHLVAPEGRKVTRVAAQFAYSDQVFQARVERVDDARDIATIKVDAILGDVPVVQGLNLRSDTLGERSPVLMIGFPNGGVSQPSERLGHTLVSPVLSAGSLNLAGRDQLEIQGFGATGASGSPVFDRSGNVIGIVFGGLEEKGRHYVVAVPSASASRLLAR